MLRAKYAVGSIVVLDGALYDQAMRILLKAIANRLFRDTRGQDMVEYALMAGFITVAVAASFPPLSGGFVTIWSRLASLLTQAS